MKTWYGTYGVSPVVGWLWTLVWIVACSCPAQADEYPIDEQEESIVFQEKTVEPYRHASVNAGYLFVTPEGKPFSASPYGRLRSGVTGGLSAGTLGADLKLSVDASVINEDDYHAELFFDYGGLVRFHAESTALWSNLLREQMTPGTMSLVNREQERDYGVRTSMTQFDSRIKFGNRPLHLNLGYWELRRDGYEQLRFSDHFFAPGASSLVTDTRRLESVTREGTVGADAHLGAFDLSYGFRIRDFSNQASDPRYPFTSVIPGGPTGDRHNVFPDSRVTSHTFKFFTDLSGGLIGSASYNLTKRENNGGHGDARPSELPSDLIQTVTGDFAYTPTKRHSFAFKYRHREIDRTTPASLVYPFATIVTPPTGITTATPGEYLLRPASSSVKDTLTVSATFRPGPKVIYRLEYNADLEERTNVLDNQSPVGTLLERHSDQRQTHTGTATFYWKPVKGGKLNATYSFASCSNPAYGDSFGDRHTGKLLITYTTSTHWGLAANYLAQFDSGSRTAATVAPAPVSRFNLPFERHDQTVSANLWFVPLERLTVTTHYSYLKSDTNQAVLFVDRINDPSPLTATNYHSSSHVYGISANYSVGEPLDLSLAFQQIRSQARYEVTERSFVLAGVAGSFNTAGLTAPSRLSTTESGVTTRADWHINQALECSLEYSMRRFDSGNSQYDGSVHATMIQLKGRW